MYPEIISADFCTDPEALILFIQKDSKIYPKISVNQAMIWWSTTPYSIYTERERKDGGNAERGEGKEERRVCLLYKSH